MAAAASLPNERRVRRFTVDEVLRMVEVGVIDGDEPLELLGGELVVVTPQGPPHAASATRLRDLVGEAYRGGVVTVREDKPLVTSSHDMPEPDIAVVRGAWDAFALRHPRGDEAVIVIELARTSLAIDRAKAETYAKGGVAVYWIVDFKGRRIEVHTEPHADGRYGQRRILAEDDEAPLPDTKVSLRAKDFLPPLE